MVMNDPAMEGELQLVALAWADEKEIFCHNVN